VTTEQQEKKEAAAPAATEKRGGLAALRVLRHREFAVFWVGQTISLIGTWMQAFAQGFLVTGLTSSAFALGLVNFASSIPTLVLMPFGGVAADRMDRRRILMWTQWAMLLLALAMGGLVQTHRLQLWHVYVIALLLGVATAYDLPAYQSFYPQLVEREDLPQAIALNQAAFHGSRIIGPAAASAVVALWGTAAAFFANATSFVAVIFTLGMIRPRPPRSDASHGSVWSSMREGFNYVRDRPSVRALLGLTGITTLCIFPNMAVLMPFYARHILHVGPRGLGWLMSMSGTGALLGAGLLLTVPPNRRVGRIALAAGIILITLSILAWSRSLWISAAAVAFQSLAISTSLGLSSIMVQEMVPDALRGRVMSLYSLVFTGVMPFASLLVTWLADAMGMRRELQIAAIVYGVVAQILMWQLSRSPSSPAQTVPASSS